MHRGRLTLLFAAALIATLAIACGSSDDEPDGGASDGGASDGGGAATETLIPLPEGCQSIDLDPLEDRFEAATGIRPDLALAQDDGESDIRAFCAIDNQQGDTIDLAAGVLVTVISPVFADEIFPLDGDMEEVTVDGRDAGYIDGYLVTIGASGRGFEIELNADRYTDAGALSDEELRDLTIAVAEHLASTY